MCEREIEDKGEKNNMEEQTCTKKQCLKMLELDGNITDLKQIRSQYLKLCLLYHPDKNVNVNSISITSNSGSSNSSDSIKFRKVINAYNYLMNRGMISDEKYFQTTVFATTMANRNGRLHLELFKCLIPYYKDYVEYTKYLFRHNYHEQCNELKMGINDMLSLTLFYYDLDIFDEYGDLWFDYQTRGYMMTFPKETLERCEQSETGLDLDLWLPSCCDLENLIHDKHIIFNSQYREYETLDSQQYLAKHTLVYSTLTLQDKIGCLAKYCISVDPELITSEHMNKIDNILMKYKLWL